MKVGEALRNGLKAAPISLNIAVMGCIHTVKMGLDRDEGQSIECQDMRSRLRWGLSLRLDLLLY